MSLDIHKIWKKEVNNKDYSSSNAGKDGWDEHRETEKLMHEDPEGLEGIRRLKQHLVFMKMTAIDTRSANTIKSLTVNKASDDVMDKTKRTVQRYFSRLKEKPFIEKKEIPDEIRKSPFVENSTQYCYEYITLQERGKNDGRKRRIREKMAEAKGGGGQ